MFLPLLKNPSPPIDLMQWLNACAETYTNSKKRFNEHASTSHETQKHFIRECIVYEYEYEYEYRPPHIFFHDSKSRVFEFTRKISLFDRSIATPPKRKHSKTPHFWRVRVTASFEPYRESYREPYSSLWVIPWVIQLSFDYTVDYTAPFLSHRGPYSSLSAIL